MQFEFDASNTWYNELGSQMTIQFNNDGSITGTYQTATGGCAQGSYPLTGRWATGSSSVYTIGFVVGWNSCYATTGWSGQLDLSTSQPTIGAFWLLTSSEAIQDRWKSTLVGQDIFTLNKPTTDQISQSLVAKGHSHP